MLIADLQLLRDRGCNFVRGAHYQQDPRFLDRCDEQGILVFAESLAWQADEKNLLGIICREALENEGVACVALWQFCDSRTYQGRNGPGRPRTSQKGLFNG
jgi:beta-galactosidase/beta-glucuronidase